MNRPALKFVLVCLVIMGALLAGTTQADAYWGRWWGGGWGCGWGCGPCCGPVLGCCDPCGGWGCARPWRVHHWCGGCCDPCGWDCGGGCALAAPGCCGGAVIGAPVIGVPAPGPTPVVPQAPAPSLDNAPAPAAPVPGAKTEILPPDAGVLTIWVPAEAKVFINGRETRSKGDHREYVSYGLKAGYTYRYEVRAEIVRDGRVVRESREVILGGGDREAVAFGFDSKKTEGVAAL